MNEAQMKKWYHIIPQALSWKAKDTVFIVLQVFEACIPPQVDVSEMDNLLIERLTEEERKELQVKKSAIDGIGNHFSTTV